MVAPWLPWYSLGRLETVGDSERGDRSLIVNAFAARQAQYRMGEDSASLQAGAAEKAVRAFLRQHWPLLLALAVLLLTVYTLRAISLRWTQGHLVYALDDAYIHMAMAKNLVEHGVWGITTDGFTSSSSSPLWTLLLAGTYALAGVNTTSPLILSLVSACLVLVVAYRMLREFQFPPNITLLTLLGVILLTPLPALVFSGMEHALQTALTVAATFLAARVLSPAETPSHRGHYLWLLSLAPLITMVRFEGMFLVLLISLGFFLRKQARRGVWFALVGFLPVAAYGAVARLHGWPLFPTSVLLKSSFSGAANAKLLARHLMRQDFFNLLNGDHLVALILFAILVEIVARARGERAWDTQPIMAAIFVGTGILHLGLARVGWFYRYEAYLVALGIVVVACRFKSLARAAPASPDLKLRTFAYKHGAVFVLVLSLSSCLMRGVKALKDIPQATINIFEQQYQMGTFVKRYYQHSTVALNDLGAVNFLADIHCLDVWGLATPEVARMRMQGHYRREDLARLAVKSGARIAIVYDMWFGRVLPSEWIRVGQWQIHNSVVVGSDTVSIYAIDPSEAAPLMAHLAEFSAQLPADVLQSGPYVEHVRSPRY